MSEMLGNQFFLARNFAAAAKELEKALKQDPNNKRIRRKLVICLNEIGEIRKAFHLFISLCKEDMDYIINADPIEDDCPCSQLIFDAENNLAESQVSLDSILRLGMYWLYCEVHESQRYFQRAHELDPDDADIRTMLTLLKAKDKYSQPLL